MQFGAETLKDILLNGLRAKVSNQDPEYLDECIRSILSRYDCVETYAEDDALLSGIPSSDISRLIRSFLDRLVQEMKRSFEYIQSQSKEIVMTKIVLSGAGTQLLNLEQYLGSNFQVAIEMVRPCQGLDFMPSVNETTFSEYFKELVLVVGCVLGKFSQINFLPVSFVVKRRVKIFVVLLGSWSALLIVCGLLIALLMHGDVAKQKKLFAKKASAVEMLRPQIQGLRTMCDVYLAKREIYDVVNVKKCIVASVLKQLSSVMPETITIKKITWEDKAFIIEGFVFDGEAGGVSKESALVDFIISLNELTQHTTNHEN